MAEAGAEQNYRFREFLKHNTRLSAEEVDRLVSQITERVWTKADCTACANCCREVVPTLSASESEHLAAHLGIGQPEFRSKYLIRADSLADNPWIIRDRPCPFLRDNLCTVYERRPAVCRDYPYLHKPDFTRRTLGMIGRLSKCPIVFEGWEELKQATGFRR